LSYFNGLELRSEFVGWTLNVQGGVGGWAIKSAKLKMQNGRGDGRPIKNVKFKMQN
jgi:hypothetical protein